MKSYMYSLFSLTFYSSESVLAALMWRCAPNCAWYIIWMRPEGVFRRHEEGFNSSVGKVTEVQRKFWGRGFFS